MPANRTRSPLAKKYGQKAVVRARNLVQSKMGIKPGSEERKNEVPWGLIGKIAQNEKKSGKVVSKKTISHAKKTYKKRGEENSLTRYTKNVSRETSKGRKKSRKT